MSPDTLVRERLVRPAHATLLRRNIDNLLARLTPHGYFPESLTGTYGGMFPRTVGALARLLDSIGAPARLRLPLDYVFRSIIDNGLERVPHVIGDTEGKDAPVPLVDATDQIDGQAHVILAWALYAHAFPENDFVQTSWPLAATLMDRSSDAPYLSRGTSWRIEPGLVLNTHLEHSREWNYWICYDFLSQSFVAAALEHMVPVAEKLGHAAHAERWRARRAFLEKQIAQQMVRDLDGTPVYTEMLLPTGRKPAVFDGLGWLNLAPIPSGWTGYDTTLFRNTLDAWHARATIDWGGPAVTACDWTPAGHTNQTYGKMLGWDLVACVRAGDMERAAGMLDFLEEVNTAPLYAEIFDWLPEEKRWKLRDAGNGEQAAWLCWALVEARKAVGLDPMP